MKWTITKKCNGMLIREFLKTEHSFSRRIIKAIIYDGGKILVNGTPKTVRYQLNTGDVLTIQFPEEQKGTYMKPEEVPLNIVYEDEAVLVINKQAGIASIPSLHHQSGTIANGVLAHYQQTNVPYTVHVVTRLDRDTSGLLLIAKHRYSHSILSSFQKQGLVKRKYYAVVEGLVEQQAGTIDANIGRKENSIIERAVMEEGQRAITHYSVKNKGSGHSLLDIELETGRTHQIRVHFSHIGHPLAGDDLYGGKLKHIKRQALHCYQLMFLHPTTKKRVTFTSPLPEDMGTIVSSN
ncbi:RluA family pseudouridine synthase [Ornithinibacillus sp. L9]|uniref:Pseudouridine synthase n=1 Tax=Ornithinibacillus caprae TaxID=2678566 RepID=A0A6N8FNX1_9BACI|nr:RluA family pseudouridine synthase [Ornithinibacillus caprae]MUK90566.1 RluA family pseudouridine synthase [Ornithinibacillus caprae]